MLKLLWGERGDMLIIRILPLPPHPSDASLSFRAVGSLQVKSPFMCL